MSKEIGTIEPGKFADLVAVEGDPLVDIGAMDLATDDMKVGVYGDAAVVTMRVRIKEADKGKETSDVLRTANTWVKKAGRWQCVATHGSRIAQ